MNADFLKTNLHFKEGIKGSYYKKIDGFLYTVDPTEENEIFLYINLPATNDEEKHAFIDFLKESLKNFTKARIVKNGIKITLTVDAFKRKSFIVNTAKTISKYFNDKNITFENKKYPIDFKNNMYVFLEEYSNDSEITPDVIEPEIPEVTDTAPEVEVQEANEVTETEVSEKAQKKKKKLFSFKKFFSFFIKSQILVILIYLLCACAFIWLSNIQISIAAVSGYFMGWLPAEILLKRGNKNSSVFLIVSFFSLITLVLSASTFILHQFLSQTEVYTISEYVRKSLIPAHCAFNAGLAFLLSMFSTYSTLPSRKKKKKETDVDFE